MKLPKSTDPKTMSENIDKLNGQIEQVDTRMLPATTSATAGQILGLVGEDKTPSWVDASSNVSTIFDLLLLKGHVEFCAKEDDPSHDYIGIKINDGELTYYLYNDLPDLSAYGVTIAYSSPWWTITVDGLIVSDFNTIYYGKNELKWQYTDDNYDHDIKVYVPIMPVTQETRKTTKKKTTK